MKSYTFRPRKFLQRLNMKTDSSTAFDFDERFKTLTGSSPFCWQRRLFHEYFTTGNLPAALDIPTGLGKTSVMVLWYIAQAAGANVPRRLVYVVNRRVVVDQATIVADEIRDKSQDSELRVSTLRGQHVDNREWLADPAVPAIIVGTVDMIGSRLLFSGYGVSRKMRPYHAGLLGSDTLVVLDEAQGFRVWRTVTPVALPVMRTGRETTGAKRVAGEAKAARAVMQALRHVGVMTPVASIRVQREPFDRNGARAEEFAMPERFEARNLRHVEIAFTQTVHGPLVIGNDRYLGLGLMVPKKDSSHDALAFSIASEANITATDSAPLLRAVRRALMALSEDKQGRVPRLFSGHEPDGAPARAGGA